MKGRLTMLRLTIRHEILTRKGQVENFGEDEVFHFESWRTALRALASDLGEADDEDPSSVGDRDRLTITVEDLG